MEERASTQQHIYSLLKTRISMGCLPRSACLGSLSLTQSPNSLVLAVSLEIRDNHLCDHPQSEGQSLHASRPGRLCAQAQSTLTSVTRFDQVMGITVDCGQKETGVKHLLDGVVWAMISPGGSIVASLKNVNGFLAVNTPLDDLIRIDFEQEGVVPKVMLHIFEELGFLLGRHSLNNEVLSMEENPPEQSRLGIFFSKEIFKGGVIYIHNAFVHDEDRTYGKVACFAHKLKGQVPIKDKQDWSFSQFFLECLKGFNTLFGEERWGIFLKKTGHRPGYL
uniref:Uncharacterized protein n=1 Tax=Tanacetum cinerariifolium TaxID=118510 RepID=A0A6L2L7T7_TANCI|nr:hypothetical protein [Tanacetum cinerariifolium]